MRSTRSAATGGVIRRRPCWRCSIQPRTTPSATTTWTWTWTSLTYCSFLRRTWWTPFRDRYTIQEKLLIARDHLVGRQLERNGLDSSDVSFSDAALLTIVEGHTREAGV